MRIGVLLLPVDPWETTVQQAQRLESLGYDHLWVYDHLSWRRYADRPWHATYPWLTGLAAATQRIRLGTLVSNLNLRHPLTLARDVATIDHISSGRVTLGLGAGGVGVDATVMGQEALTPGDRVDRLAEAIPLIDGLLRGEVTEHRGERYDVENMRSMPHCVQRPRVPLAVAAGGPRTIRLAAEYADIWVTWGDTTLGDLSEDGTARAVAGQMGTLDEHCEAVGRNPQDIARLHLIGNTEARPLRSIDAFLEYVDRYRDLGFTDLVFHMPRLDDPVWHDDPSIVEEIADACFS